MNDNKVIRPGFCTILFIVFFVLKMTNTVDWSWWWVTAPLWIPLCFIVGCILLAVIIMGIVGILNS